jgi:hypothetical protein
VDSTGESGSMLDAVCWLSSAMGGGDLTAPSDPETRASFLGEVLGLCEAAGQEAAFPALVDSQPRAARGL